MDCYKMKEKTTLPIAFWDEFYGPYYTCPFCKEDELCSRFKFCPMCGESLKEYRYESVKESEERIY